MDMLDLGELVSRAVKYLVEGLVVAIVAFAIPKRSLKMDEVALIALTASASFALMDSFMPSIAVSARNGAGFGIGSSLVGGLRLA